MTHARRMAVMALIRSRALWLGVALFVAGLVLGMALQAFVLSPQIVPVDPLL